MLNSNFILNKGAFIRTIESSNASLIQFNFFRVLFDRLIGSLQQSLHTRSVVGQVSVQDAEHLAVHIDVLANDLDSESAVLRDQSRQQVVQSLQHSADLKLGLSLLGQLCATGHDNLQIVSVSVDQLLGQIVVSFGRNLFYLIYPLQIVQAGERADVIVDLLVGVA